MKKRITLLAIAMVGCSAIFAQSFKFVKVKDQFNHEIIGDVENGSEITIDTITQVNWGSVEDPMMGDPSLESLLGVVNLTSNDIHAIGSQKVITAPAQGNLQFCFQSCNNTNGDYSQENTILANEPLEGYHMAFFPVVGQYTSAKVIYKVENKNNPSDFVSVTVHYNYVNPNGITSNKYQKSVNVYQKGTEAELSYNFESDANRQVTLFNVMGREVASRELNGSNGTVTLPSLAKGVYLYSIVENGSVIATRKFVIK